MGKKRLTDKLIIGNKTVTINTIRSLYSDEGMSWKEIAIKYDTYPNKIARFAERHGIKPRDKSESQAILFKRGKRVSPTKGTTRSKEVKEKISKKQADTWSKFSDVERAQRCQMSKDAWDSKTPEEKRALMEAATRGLLQVAKDGSKIEKYMQEALRNAGYAIEPHKGDILPGTKTHVDIFIQSMATAIEIDGPAHFRPIWGQAKLDGHIRKDNTKNAALIAAGFTLIRVKYMLSSSSLAKMRYATEQVLEALDNVKKHPETYHNTIVNIEVN